jgi:hypothetical protein
MTKEESGPLKGLGQATPITDPISALEELAQKTTSDAARHILEANESDDPGRARILYQMAAVELRTAAKTADALRKYRHA